MKKGAKEITLRPRHEFQPKIVKSPLFDKDLGKVTGFIMTCKLYIRMKMRKELVEEQVHYILTYIQKELVDV